MRVTVMADLPALALALQPARTLSLSRPSSRSILPTFPSPSSLTSSSSSRLFRRKARGRMLGKQRAAGHPARTEAQRTSCATPGSACDWKRLRTSKFACRRRTSRSSSPYSSTRWVPMVSLTSS
ncbi:hypothetical protein AAT19DRAFT_12356 [Rhodotorula toruloides]|uniref:Uncharacterized protein n=1 Tax=Rhodotorula toruloides TaxID=5286 RepID=A0A2T0AG08_RHOTO|nr:hypothetical protein AAT19DRAFT_12356 [Rhodotorula toruloides]